MDLAEIIVRSTEGVPIGRWALVHQGGEEASIWRDWGALGCADDFVAAATEQAARRGWRIVARIDPQRWPDLIAAFRCAGWQARSRRVEWTHSLSDLPADTDGRLRWVCITRQRPAMVDAVLAQAVCGDPLAPASGTPTDWMRGWREAPGLSGTMEVGFEDGQAVAFTSGQARCDGWCRIPYAGLLPHMRGRRLGAAIITRGIALMRSAGGWEWRDGCAADNAAVLAIVRRWGIVPDSPREEWIPPS
jgi:hypothetical protein